MLRLIGALIILATLAGGILYLQSDVFRTKANEQYNQWTKWTPENITSDPKGYLNFALTELEKIQKQLEAHKLDLNVRLDTAEQRRKTEDMRATASARALDRLKNIYLVDTRTFPVSVEGQNLSEAQFEERVVEVDRQMGVFKENSERLGQHIAHLQGELTRTEQEMKKLVDKRQFVQQRLDHLKLDLAVGSADELTSKADEIAAIAKHVTREGSKAQQEAVNLISAEEKKLQTQNVKERFEQIMGSK
jgi:hypothetical protein